MLGRLSSAEVNSAASATVIFVGNELERLSVKVRSGSQCGCNSRERRKEENVCRCKGGRRIQMKLHRRNGTKMRTETGLL